MFQFIVTKLFSIWSDASYLETIFGRDAKGGAEIERVHSMTRVPTGAKV